MIDPLSLTGLAIITGGIGRHNTCPVCNKIKLFSTWESWSCCHVKQCRDCAAATERSKTCRNCGRDVK